MKPSTVFSRDGFTLVEILIAMTVMSVAMLGITQLAVRDSKTAKSQNLDFDFTIMSSNVGMVLENSCTNSLANQTLQLNSAIHLSLNTPQPPSPYTVLSTTPTNQAGIQATSLTFTKVLGPVATAADGTREFIGNVTLQAKKFLSGGVIDTNAHPYRKEFEVDAWIDAGNLIKSCQRALDPTGSSVALTSSAAACPNDTRTGTWAITSGVVKSAYLVSGTTQVPATITSATGGTFSITLPSTLGPYNATYTLFVTGPFGEGSWGNATAQSVTFNIGASPIPCP